jgi:hypothetical protein
MPVCRCVHVPQEALHFPNKLREKTGMKVTTEPVSKPTHRKPGQNHDSEWGGNIDRHIRIRWHYAIFTNSGV